MKYPPLAFSSVNWFKIDFFTSNIMVFRARSRIFHSGGMDPFWGGFGLQHGHFSVKMYAKTKELGPVGGHVSAHTPPDLPMVLHHKT